MNTVENYKNEFINLATSNIEYLMNDNYKAANKLADKLYKLHIKFKKENKLFILEDLLEDKNESVVYWASSFYLEHNSEKAVKKLKLLEEQSIPLIKSYAYLILYAWRKSKTNTN